MHWLPKYHSATYSLTVSMPYRGHRTAGSVWPAKPATGPLPPWVTAGSEAKLCGVGVLPYKVALKAESACDLGQQNLATRT